MIKIDFKIDDLALKFKEMQRDVILVLAAAMQTNRSMMFDKDGADNDKPRWEPLSFRTGRPLQNSGTLRKSMAPQNDGIRPGMGRDGIVRIESRAATIGTNLLYAGLMNDGTAKMPGGVLKPVKAQALRFPAGILKGAPGVKDGFMFRRSVKIPTRRMNEVTTRDTQEWADTMANFIAERLNG